MKLTPEQAREINEEISRVTAREDGFSRMVVEAREEKSELLERGASRQMQLCRAYLNGMQFVIQVLGYMKLTEEE